MSDSAQLTPFEHSLANETVPKCLMEKIGNALRQKEISTKSIQLGLARLDILLDEKFSREETRGHFDEVLQSKPWLTGCVRQLKAQHGALLESLAEIKEISGCVPQSPPGLRWELRQRYESFVEKYLEHEAGEQNLLDEAFPGPDWCDDINAI